MATPSVKQSRTAKTKMIFPWNNLFNLYSSSADGLGRLVLYQQHSFYSTEPVLERRSQSILEKNLSIVEHSGSIRY